jgi:thymidylate kinase
MNNSGNFIIFEGLPGAGKTTLTRRIANRYNGFRIGEHLAPNFKEILYQDIAKPCMHFFLESDKRKYQLAQNISKKGLLILMDRGIVSTLAYSYSLASMTGDNSMHVFEKDWFNKQPTIFVPPVAYIYLSLTPEYSNNRTNNRKDRKETPKEVEDSIEDLRHTSFFYQQFFSNEHKHVPLYSIDGTLSLDEVIRKVENIIDNNIYPKLLSKQG